MNLIANPTTPPPAEDHVRRTGEIASAALTALKADTIETFRRLWHAEIPAADQLAVMGTRAGAAFDQHAATVQFLLASGMEMEPADYTPLAYTVHSDGTVTIN